MNTTIRYNRTIASVAIVLLFIFINTGCGVQEVSQGQAIPFTDAIGTYTGDCTAFDEDGNVVSVSVETLVVSAFNLEVATLKSPCSLMDNVMIDYDQTLSDTIRLRDNLMGSVYVAEYLKSSETLQVSVLQNDNLVSSYRGSK